jgi:hypothetical protein
MAQIIFNHVGGKSPFFDGTSFDYWKRKMKMYLCSINDKVWDVVENGFVILDLQISLTMTRSTNNVIPWHSTPYIMALIQRCLNKSKILRKQVKFG